MDGDIFKENSLFRVLVILELLKSDITVTYSSRN